MAKNADFHITLDEDFYKKFWYEPTGKPYESMMDKPRVKKDDKSSKEKVETEVKEETK